MKKIVSTHPNTECFPAILHSMGGDEVCNLYSDHEDNMASINFVEFSLMWDGCGEKFSSYGRECICDFFLFAKLCRHSYGNLIRIQHQIGTAFCAYVMWNRGCGILEIRCSYSLYYRIRERDMLIRSFWVYRWDVGDKNCHVLFVYET